MNYSFLYEMLETESPSGLEFNLQKKVIKYMENDADKVITHHSGNVINVLNPNSDITAIRNNMISITPITYDMTRKTHIDELQGNLCRDDFCEWFND